MSGALRGGERILGTESEMDAPPQPPAPGGVPNPDFFFY